MDWLTVLLSDYLRQEQLVLSEEGREETTDYAVLLVILVNIPIARL